MAVFWPLKNLHFRGESIAKLQEETDLCALVSASLKHYMDQIREVVVSSFDFGWKVANLFLTWLENNCWLCFFFLFYIFTLSRAKHERSNKGKKCFYKTDNFSFVVSSFSLKLHRFFCNCKIEKSFAQKAEFLKSFSFKKRKKNFYRQCMLKKGNKFEMKYSNCIQHWRWAKKFIPKAI